jgi:hypothetical protein
MHAHTGYEPRWRDGTPAGWAVWLAGPVFWALVVLVLWLIFR